MLIAKQTPLLPPSSAERRRFQRVRLDLQGRYMLANGQEFPCQVANMSPGGMALVASASAPAGERVIAYVDEIGRIAGVVARQFPSGFALRITSTTHKRDKLAAQLTWLANRHILPDQRRHPRIAPRDPWARIILQNGLQMDCRIIDISQSGAGIASDQRPQIGALVTIGRTHARVARHIEKGFAVEFLRLQHQGSLEENVTGR
jgi:PilZ domain